METTVQDSCYLNIISKVTMFDNKRELRELKRELKKAGNKNRRNYFKRQLRDNPGEAHWDEYFFEFDSTKEMNGKPSKYN